MKIKKEEKKYKKLKKKMALASEYYDINRKVTKRKTSGTSVIIYK